MNDRRREPPEDLAAWIRAQLGPACRTSWAGWDHAESEVWRVGAGDRLAYCKRHRSPGKHAAERAALERWAPQLPGTPTLIAILPADAPALLMTAVPGAPVDGLDVDEDTLAAIHERAGAWLARLHALAWDDRDPLPLGVAMRRRADSWLARARGIVDDDVHAWVAAAAEPLVELDAARVPCHRDFSPRNWLWDGQRLGVIDFEHARADWWLHDLDRLEARCWHGRPRLREAFLRGYGRRPSDAERAWARGLAIVQALSTIVWARAHADREFEREGWTRLQLLRGDEATVGPTVPAID